MVGQGDPAAPEMMQVTVTDELDDRMLLLLVLEKRNQTGIELEASSLLSRFHDARKKVLFRLLGENCHR